MTNVIEEISGSVKGRDLCSPEADHSSDNVTPCDSGMYPEWVRKYPTMWHDYLANEGLDEITDKTKGNQAKVYNERLVAIYENVFDGVKLVRKDFQGTFIRHCLRVQTQFLYEDWCVYIRSGLSDRFTWDEFQDHETWIVELRVWRGFHIPTKDELEKKDMELKFLSMQ